MRSVDILLASLYRQSQIVKFILLTGMQVGLKG